jgi:serine/threonine-protein kinase
MSDEPEPKSAPRSPAAELTGRIGRYEIRHLLGRGAMGAVYLAHDTVLERDVALKVMVAHIADDPTLKKRFEHEAKAVAKMTHPNVVTVHDLGYHRDGSPFIAMELLEGVDLRAAMRQGPPMPLERKVSVILQVLAGLARAHQADVVHRDIKPANVFITSDGVVKIMDFGVARLATASMTGTGSIVGTADYMSPEQAKGGRVDGRSDVFAVGCMLYELLAGNRPFHAENLMAIFYRITHEEPDFGLIGRTEEHATLLPILRKALAKNLDDRYQSAQEFGAALRDWLRATAASRSEESTPDERGQGAEAPPFFADSAAPTLVSEEEERTSAETLSQQTDVDADRNADSVTRPPLAATIVDDAGGSTARAPGRRPVPPAAAPGRAAAALEPTIAAPREPGARLRREPPPGKSWPVPAAIGGLGVATAVALFFILQGPKPPLPSPAPPVSRESVPPPGSPEPPRWAEALRAAQAALASGEYDEAARRAKEVLEQDPGNVDARTVLDKAALGQKAAVHFQAAEVAVGRGDLETAYAEAEAGRSNAPADERGLELLTRIRAMREEKRQQSEKRLRQINDLLATADGHLQERRYDEAIGAYEKVIAVDPGNGRALNGKSMAVQGKLNLPRAPTAPPGKIFVPGKTIAEVAKPHDDFEKDPRISVQTSAPASLPGKIEFAVEPKQVKPGDKYTVRVFFRNEGTAPIVIQSLTVITTVNGGKSGGSVPSLLKELAPQQKALLFADAALWKEDTLTWSMEVVVGTARKGETYRNQVTWQ